MRGRRDCSGVPDDACAGGLGTYVSNGGDDSHPGTKAMPVKTIAQGMKNAAVLANGQRVFVSKGHYPEKITLV